MDPSYSLDIDFNSDSDSIESLLQHLGLDDGPPGPGSDEENLSPINLSSDSEKDRDDDDDDSKVQRRPDTVFEPAKDPGWKDDPVSERIPVLTVMLDYSEDPEDDGLTSGFVLQKVSGVVGSMTEGLVRGASGVFCLAGYRPEPYARGEKGVSGRLFFAAAYCGGAAPGALAEKAYDAGVPGAPRSSVGLSWPPCTACGVETWKSLCRRSDVCFSCDVHPGPSDGSRWILYPLVTPKGFRREDLWYADGSFAALHDLVLQTHDPSVRVSFRRPREQKRAPRRKQRDDDDRDMPRPGNMHFVAHERHVTK